MIDGPSPARDPGNRAVDFKGGTALQALFAFPLPRFFRLFVQPLTNERIFAFLFILSFIPFFRFNFTTVHTVGDSLIQGIPQILLITLSLIVGLLRLTYRPSLLMAFCAVLCIGISQAVGLVHSPAAEKNWVIPATFTLLAFIGPVVNSLAVKIDVPSRGDFIARVTKVVLGVMSMECALRYAFSPFIETGEKLDRYGTDAINEGWFYPYKQSLLYSDSNAVGIALLCLIAVMLVYRRHFQKRHLVLAYFLVLASLSRASMISAIVQFLIYKIWRWRRWLLGGLVVSSPLALYGLLSWYINSSKQAQSLLDPSFVSKLYILQTTLEIFGNADLTQYLFGVGSGNTLYLAGIAAHNILVVFALEFGIVGSAFLIAYVWLLIRRSPPALYLLIVPMLINGFSLFLTTIPFFYFALAFLASVKDIRPGESIERNGLRQQRNVRMQLS